MQSLRALRPQVGMRSFAAPSSSLLRFNKPAVRCAHTIPKLDGDEVWCEKGLPEFLSADGYKMAWHEYQLLLVNKLTQLTEGTVYDEALPFTIALATARDPNRAHLFNYASMAHNNHFFFEGLSPEPKPMPEQLRELIEESCSSVEGLKTEMFASAKAMFGPGFVWLCKDKDMNRKLKIINTYIAGSPYAQAHHRRQPIDVSTQPAENLPSSPSLGPNQFGAGIRPYSATAPLTNRDQRILPPGGIDLQPILCLNTWQHVYLFDYGLYGRDLYFERWWNSVNWEKVLDRYADKDSRRQNISSP